MERVAFLLEPSGERLSCLLNPETVEVRRAAGVQTRRSLGSVVTSAGLSDDPLVFTGGGVTLLKLQLLFDVTLSGTTMDTSDVRDLTRPIWELAENRLDDQGYGSPPHVRFIWGKSWNFPAVVTAVAERFDFFTSDGEPRRSWLSMRLVRIAEEIQPPSAQIPFAHNDELVDAALKVPEEDLIPYEMPGAGTRTIQIGPEAGAVRIDEIAAEYYGDPGAWRPILAINDIEDPLRIPAGTILRIPPASSLTRYV